MEWGSEDTSGALTAGWGQSAKEMGVADPRMGVATPGGGGPQWGGTPTSDDWSSVVKHKVCVCVCVLQEVRTCIYVHVGHLNFWPKHVDYSPCFCSSFSLHS